MKQIIKSSRLVTRKGRRNKFEGENLELRLDNISNCISTVTKDFLITIINLKEE